MVDLPYFWYIYIYIYIYIQHKILKLYSIIELTSHKHNIVKRLKSQSTIETQIGAQHAQNTYKKKKTMRPILI